eukprot:TRINITY_DN4102_c0_g1_i1.p1 TRINITY_DN4102_c0_g1~~TRINITY_DN4102_c0_g1_i1.p1  ORF type:complete len:389 (-),score=49.73 TRINITY_DN4102_c0_g1_i1:48-1193(-)
MEGFLGTRPRATPSASKAVKRAELPWVEKYRPRSVDDVAHQDEVVRALKSSIESANLPHLLFYGPPGTGKTSTILAIARELYGPALMPTRVLELNASDERGINVIQNKVKNFARVATSVQRVGGDTMAVEEEEEEDEHHVSTRMLAMAQTDTNERNATNQTPPYKLIILDEADSMTADAQAALRRIMEVHTRVTRFCLICNYVSRIIDPLASRCAKFRFRPLSRESMDNRLQYICDQEGITATPLLFEKLAFVSGGDMRRAIMLLQSAYRLEGASVSPDLIHAISGRVPDGDIVELLAICGQKSFKNMQLRVQSIVHEGHSAAQTIIQMTSYIVNSEDLSEKQKAMICMKLAEADYSLSTGANEYLQLLDVCGHIQKVMTG